MAVVGVIAYRISTLAALQVLTRDTPVTNSTFIASTAELVYQNASLVTTVTAACINLLIIVILNFVSKRLLQQFMKKITSLFNYDPFYLLYISCGFVLFHWRYWSIEGMNYTV